jgi:hypothetical protein
MSTELVGGPEWRAYIDKAVAHHEKDLYQGDGKQNPSITTRLTTCEEFMERSTVAAERSAARAFRIQLMLLGTIVTALADIAVHLLIHR